MRWTEIELPKDGKTRIIKRFLFLPICIGNEYRWLEIATIKQFYDIPSTNIFVGEWNNSAWID